MKTLYAWLGNTDLRAVSDGSMRSGGPILSALMDGGFDGLELLTDQGDEKTAVYTTWLRKHFHGDVNLHPVALRSPIAFDEIYRFVDSVLHRAPKRQERAFHLSPGTPAMAAVWIIAAKSAYPAALVQTSEQQGFQIVDLPFNIAAEFLPASIEADAMLVGLSQGLPPEAPEFGQIVHRCDAMKREILKARRLATRDVPVLIQGESGTGKELFARAIHSASLRRNKPIAIVNCGAIPAELVDSELFGHVKGAFTGASTDRVGYFEAADGGTLFLDEIGELPLASQVRLLRVLQEGEVTRVGSTTRNKVDVRVIAATNRVLPVEVRQGRFREDLFHRLAVGVLQLPPLRRREGDLSLLVDAILEYLNLAASKEPGFKPKKLSVEAKKLVLGYSWPGNVRELHNTLLRASIWSSAASISGPEMQEALSIAVPAEADSILDRPFGDGINLQEIIEIVAKHYLSRAMAQANGNKTEAARLVGLSSYQTLSNWLSRYGVE